MSTSEGKHGRIVIGGKIVDGEIVGGTEIAKIDSWTMDEPDAPVEPANIPVEEYHYTGTFKVPFWQRFRYRRYVRKVFGKRNQKIDVTFIGRPSYPPVEPEDMKP